MQKDKNLEFREARLADIPAIHVVRMAVTENVLSNPALVTEAHYCEMLEKGKGWVCAVNGQIVGFSIVDLSDKNIWALFVLPEFEKQGIGRELHKLMLDWAFRQEGMDYLWLGTGQNTRAEIFYQHAGWQRVGIKPNTEIEFRMTRQVWQGVSFQGEKNFIFFLPERWSVSVQGEKK